MRTQGEERTPVPPLGERLEFIRLLWAIDHGLHTRSIRMAATLGVTGQQRLVVRIVGRFPGVSPGQLARILHLDPSTLTGILRRLERAGLLERRDDPRDGRRAVLQLSVAGRRLDGSAIGGIEVAMESVLARFRPGRIRAARAVLAALAEELLAEADPLSSPPKPEGQPGVRRGASRGRTTNRARG